MDLSGSRRQRARKLSRKIASSPVLPVLGITKAVETVIAGAGEVSEAAQDAVDDATDTSDT
jgi:hypothetical protein